jgi:hypothetical protein
MAADLKVGLDDMARQSELDDLRMEVEAMRVERFDPVALTTASLTPGAATAGEPAFDAVAAHAANMAAYAQERAAEAAAEPDDPAPPAVAAVAATA